MPEDIPILLDDRDAVMRSVREVLDVLAAYGHQETYEKQLSSLVAQIMEPHERAEIAVSVALALHASTLVATGLKGLYMLAEEETDELDLMRAIENGIEELLRKT
jgi:hypothetical protein